MLTKHYHVTYDDGVWKVFKEGWTIPSTCADSRSRAIRCARSLAQQSGGRVFVHRGGESPSGEIPAGRSPARSPASVS